MKQLLFCILLCFLTNLSLAQDKISLYNLEEIFVENNPARKARKAELQVFEGRRREAGKKANPALHTVFESLGKGPGEAESSITIAQELDLTHSRHWFVRSLEHAQKASAFQLAFEIQAELAEVKKRFCRALLLEKDVAALNKVLETITEMETRTRIRLADGDVSEVDLMRLSAEKKKISLLIENLKNEAALEQRLLLTNLGLTAASIEFVDDMLPVPNGFDAERLYLQALENRADLKAARENLLSGENSIIAEKKQVKSPVTLEGGYKARNGGFNGFIVAVSAPLPFVNRNEGKISELNARNAAEKLRIEALEHEIAGKLRASVIRLSFLADRQEKHILQIEELKKIAQIARLNFEENDEGLIEVLDAVREQSDLILNLNRTIMDSWSLVFDLETLTGLNLTHNGDKE